MYCKHLGMIHEVLECRSGFYRLKSGWYPREEVEIIVSPPTLEEACIERWGAHTHVGIWIWAFGKDEPYISLVVGLVDVVSDLHSVCNKSFVTYYVSRGLRCNTYLAALIDLVALVGPISDTAEWLTKMRQTHTEAIRQSKSQ
jgi:hypothetical protein